MKKHNFSILLLIIAIVLLAVNIFQNINTDRKEKVSFSQWQDQQNEVLVQPINNYIPPNAPDFVNAAEETVNAVVHIKTKMTRKSEVYDFFYDFFGQSPQNGYRQPVYTASGSGVIISGDGYIVTNNHVVDGANEIEVILNDKRSFSAELIGNDASTDLAVIKIEEEDLPYLQFGNSDNVKVGEWVLAVGNPFNLTSTVTAGIVSAKARNINILGRGNNSAIESFIQTDAAVNRGNSGGALVNTNGQLIGINAAIASNTGSYTGYAFAIPSNLAQKVVGDLIQFGEAQRGFLGVSIAEMNAGLAAEKGMDEIKGVYVVSVIEDGAADKAGIGEGSVVLMIEGQEVNSTAELMSKVAQHRPGEIINVTVFDDGDVEEYSLTLRNLYGSTKIVSEKDEMFVKELGAAFTTPDQDLMKDLGIEYGMQIAALKGGALSKKGIEKGFIIERLNKQEIRNLDDIKDAVSNVNGGLLIEGIYPGGQRVYYGIGL
jgi:serine protease Do